MFDLALRMRWFRPMLLVLALAAPTAAGAPITSAPQGLDSALRASLSERDILDSRHVDEFAGASAAAFATDVLRNDERERRSIGNSPLPNSRLLDTRDSFGGAQVFETLRTFVNLAPAAGAAKPRPSASRDEVHPLSGIDLGPEARAWVQDAFTGIVDSVLQLEVNERGHSAFSVLGFGQFGIAVSGDRSQLALTAGDEVLLTAQRAPDSYGGSTAAGGAGSSGYGGPGGPGGAAGNTAGAQGESPLRKMVELVFGVAGHPLSLLVYLVVAAYIVLWSILSRQSRRQARHGGALALAASGIAAPARSGRRRHRHRTRRSRRT